MYRMEGIMRLELENVGKISSANIKLDGITVIAGENNTGKSTIGKMLFWVVSASHRIEEQIKEERVKSVSRVLSSYYPEAANRLTRRFNTVDLAEVFVDKKEIFLGDIRLIEKEIEEYFVNKDKNFNQYIKQESLEKLSQDRTTFVIAHRLSTIKNADQIIVMDQGHIVEIGNHEELLQKQGYYHQLYYSQFETE